MAYQPQPVNKIFENNNRLMTKELLRFNLETWAEGAVKKHTIDKILENKMRRYELIGIMPGGTKWDLEIDGSTPHRVLSATWKLFSMAYQHVLTGRICERDSDRHYLEILIARACRDIPNWNILASEQAKTIVLGAWQQRKASAYVAKNMVLFAREFVGLDQIVPAPDFKKLETMIRTANLHDWKYSKNFKITQIVAIDFNDCGQSAFYLALRSGCNAMALEKNDLIMRKSRKFLKIGEKMAKHLGKIIGSCVAKKGCDLLRKPKITTLLVNNECTFFLNSAKKQQIRKVFTYFTKKLLEDSIFITHSPFKLDNKIRKNRYLKACGINSQKITTQKSVPKVNFLSATLLDKTKKVGCFVYMIENMCGKVLMARKSAYFKRRSFKKRTSFFYWRKDKTRQFVKKRLFSKKTVERMRARKAEKKKNKQVEEEERRKQFQDETEESVVIRHPTFNKIKGERDHRRKLMGNVSIPYLSNANSFELTKRNVAKVSYTEIGSSDDEFLTSDDTIESEKLLSMRKKKQTTAKPAKPHKLPTNNNDPAQHQKDLRSLRTAHNRWAENSSILRNISQPAQKLKKRAEYDITSRKYNIRSNRQNNDKEDEEYIPPGVPKKIKNLRRKVIKTEVGGDEEIDNMKAVHSKVDQSALIIEKRCPITIEYVDDKNEAALTPIVTTQDVLVTSIVPIEYLKERTPTVAEENAINSISDCPQTNGNCVARKPDFTKELEMRNASLIEEAVIISSEVTGMEKCSTIQSQSVIQEVQTNRNFYEELKRSGVLQLNSPIPDDYDEPFLSLSSTQPSTSCVSGTKYPSDVQPVSAKKMKRTPTPAKTCSECWELKKSRDHQLLNAQITQRSNYQYSDSFIQKSKKSMQLERHIFEQSLPVSETGQSQQQDSADHPEVIEKISKAQKRVANDKLLMNIHPEKKSETFVPRIKTPDNLKKPQPESVEDPISSTAKGIVDQSFCQKAIGEKRVPLEVAHQAASFISHWSSSDLNLKREVEKLASSIQRKSVTMEGIYIQQTNNTTAIRTSPPLQVSPSDLAQLNSIISYAKNLPQTPVSRQLPINCQQTMQLHQLSQSKQSAQLQQLRPAGKPRKLIQHHQPLLPGQLQIGLQPYQRMIVGNAPYPIRHEFIDEEKRAQRTVQIVENPRMMSPGPFISTVVPPVVPQMMRSPIAANAFPNPIPKYAPIAKSPILPTSSEPLRALENMARRIDDSFQRRYEPASVNQIKVADQNNETIQVQLHTLLPIAPQPIQLPPNMNHPPVLQMFMNLLNSRQ